MKFSSSDYGDVLVPLPTDDGLRYDADAARAKYLKKPRVLRVDLPAYPQAQADAGGENEVAAPIQPVSEMGGISRGCGWQGPARPKSALRRPSGKGGVSSAGKGIQFRSAAELQEIFEIEASGNGNPTPPRGGGSSRRQNSAGKALMSDPEIVALMSQPGVVGPLQEIMSNPQVGLEKYRDNYPVIMTFMKIQEKMKIAMAAPPPVADEDEEVNFEDQAIGVLLKRGRAAVARGDLKCAREALKSGLTIDMTNTDLKTLAHDIKAMSDMGGPR